MMKYRWSAVALLVVAMVSSCSNGDSRLNVDDGKRLADKTRRPVAETYWQLNDAIGSSVFLGVGEGSFTDCEKTKVDSLIYRVENLLTAGKGRKEPAEHLANVASQKLDSIGWRLEPASGVHRSAIKNGVKVELRPTGINDWSIVLQVESGCVNLGAAAHVLEDAYDTAIPDRYDKSRAGSARVPTGFPDPDSSGS